MNSTREQLLEHNYIAMRLHGFQGLRTDKVLADLRVTKGAFYHYFPDKLSLGYAIIDEIIKPNYLNLWKKVEENVDQPIDSIIKLIEFIQTNILKSEEDAKLGCPLNNLIQEMSPLDDGFKNRLQFIVAEQRRMLTNTFKNAQKRNLIRSTSEPEELSIFFLSSVEGAFSIAKALQSKRAFDYSMTQLKLWLKSL
jgi:AcrR family transcriptional regulator